MNNQNEWFQRWNGRHITLQGRWFDSRRRQSLYPIKSVVETTRFSLFAVVGEKVCDDQFFTLQRNWNSCRNQHRRLRRRRRGRVRSLGQKQSNCCLRLPRIESPITPPDSVSNKMFPNHSKRAIRSVDDNINHSGAHKEAEMERWRNGEMERWRDGEKEIVHLEIKSWNVELETLWSRRTDGDCETSQKGKSFFGLQKTYMDMALTQGQWRSSSRSFLQCSTCNSSFSSYCPPSSFPPAATANKIHTHTHTHTSVLILLNQARKE